LRHQLAHFLGQVFLLALALFQLGRERRRGGQRLPGHVVDHLRIDMVQAAVDREARALLRALDVLADVRLAAQPQQLLSHVGRRAHHAAPVLPCLRRMVSSAYLIPLPLWGSGGRSLRISAATSPMRCVSAPFTATRLRLASYSAVTTCGEW